MSALLQSHCPELKLLARGKVRDHDVAGRAGSVMDLFR